MIIGLHDAEKDHMKHKTFPNYALMKISAYHKSKGDIVKWWSPITTSIFDVIYSSKVFDFTPTNPYLPDWAIRGGTGYKDIPLNQKLPDNIDKCFPDYSIYPECDYAIGYLTRGCPNKCPWCVVPQKEGKITPYRNWEEIVRPDSKKLVLMDNNILACDFGISQLESLIGSGYKIDLNQGMDARLVNDDIASILGKLEWIKYIRFSCDSKSQIEPIYRAVNQLGKHGIKPYKIFIYLLVTKDIDDAAYRVECLKKISGINIYAQAERNGRKNISPNKMQLEFANRYIYSRCYKSESWPEYLKRHEYLHLDRAAIRAITPPGFAKAFFDANR